MRSDRERLLDILEAIEKIKQYTLEGKQAFETNELIQVWIVRHLQVIGEAASRVSIETQNRFPFIPWKRMIGMRHVLVHGYFEIDLDIVWSVIEKDLPPLEEQIQAALKSIE
ncbi:MAG: DUF86 domain-containing protein [Anaerolineaceae bacterium]|jgi:uncharacterized protein with HEPN domain|nr:DUF86 domain-containing protein [Anaerolineaceae bacterium]